MIILILVFIGTWIIQDSLASIAFYPHEKLKWNHAARLARMGMGIVLVIVGGLLLGGC